MNAKEQTKKQRQYFIDWLRIGLIISVFFFHIGMIFNPWGWHIKSEETFYFLEPIMHWLHLWRMPLLFLVSGVGTFYALGFRTTKQYLKERITRLFIPFIIGIFILVPIQVYIEKIDQFSSLSNFYTHMFDGIYPVGNFSWHHLWFILYLLVISLLISPFIKYTRSGHFNMLRGRLIALGSKKMGLNWLLPIIIGSQLILRQYFPDSTHALFNDWAYIMFYLLFFIIGFVLFTSNKVIQAVANQRRLYALQTVIFTLVMFSFWVFKMNIPGSRYIYSATEIIIAFSCGLSAIGYCKVYFNKDHKYRKILNEAIYPFYLLHQPLIILVGYIVLKWQLPTVVNVVLITVVSLLLAIGIYGLIIKRSNVLRVAFGMKKLAPKKALVPQNTFVHSQSAKLQPIMQSVPNLERNKNEII